MCVCEGVFVKSPCFTVARWEHKLKLLFPFYFSCRADIILPEVCFISLVCFLFVMYTTRLTRHFKTLLKRRKFEGWNFPSFALIPLKLLTMFTNFCFESFSNLFVWFLVQIRFYTIGFVSHFSCFFSYFNFSLQRILKSFQYSRF